MISLTNVLLICVVFLCGMEETVLSRRGHCTGNQCFALFQKPDDFLGAQEVCKNFDGQLFVFNLEHLQKILRSSPNGLSGSYWLELHSTGGTTEEAVTGLQNCSYISGQNSTVLWKPCRENLDGFLCQYTFEESCSSLQAGGGAQVKYTAHMGFEVTDSERFPLGTIGEEAGGTYPDSRYLCYSSGWLRAPWNCEVMQGGCEYSCASATHTCTCPTGQTLHPNNITCTCPTGQALHPNNITCTADPCADCAHECQQVGENYVCTCREGYELAQDMKLCVDVDECKGNPCTGEGEECVNTQGRFECQCKDGFDEEDGVCEDVAICEKCEHMKCEKFNGVYMCMCREGYKVSPLDPTQCELNCTERDCPASCIDNDCFCPNGYIKDSDDGVAFCTDINECENEWQCDHKCENLFGGYRCLCDEGYKLHNDECLWMEDDGSGSTSAFPTPVSAHPAAVPSYIKTGSVLGITVFMLLCAALLFFLIRSTAKRCGKFQLTSFKHPNIDIFYLQQVTTETYKRLSFDKQLKNDFQIPSSHL